MTFTNPFQPSVFCESISPKLPFPGQSAAFQPFVLLKVITSQCIQVYSFFLWANVVVRKKPLVLAPACPQIQGAGSTGWGCKSGKWLGRSRGRTRPPCREPRCLTSCQLFLSQCTAGIEQMQGKIPFGCKMMPQLGSVVPVCAPCLPGAVGSSCSAAGTAESLRPHCCCHLNN